MKILVVSGFLGAGKTTFIKEMSRKTGRDFVVMENEYARAGMDRAFLEEGQKINVWELTEGCICCTMKSDFASSILTIANTLDPEYLVVEPTGVGVLSSVMQNIRQIEYERITLLAPVTVVDADSFERCMADYRDIFLDQLKAAGTIVISRRSFVSQEEADQFCEQLRRLSPEANIRLEHYTGADDAWWERLLSTDYAGNALPAPAQEECGMESLSLYDISLSGSWQLLFFLEELARGRYGGVFRAKGVVDLPGCRLRFDMVNGIYSITGFEGEERSGAVFIGRELERGLLRERLVSCFYFRSAQEDAGRKQGALIRPKRRR